ncbi:MAG: YeeE/YedE thiosulfate transporter family protein [Bacteroidota bacterium]
MGPLITQGIIDPAWNNVIAVLIGIGFGFVLESAGFSSSRKLAGVFYGYDFVVLKVFFTAAITASVGMLYFSYLGWIDLSMIFVNPTVVKSGIVGGLIMGLGFIMGGFCPGTSICAAAIGKIDAMFFTGGMFVGIFIFSEAYPLYENFYNATNLGPMKVNEVLGLSPGIFIFVLSVVAVAAFYVTSLIEKRIDKVDY